MSYGFRISNLLIIFTVENKTRTTKSKKEMRKFETHIEDAEVSCTLVARNQCGPDEYEVVIKIENRLYRIYTLVGPFEQHEAVCNRVYTEWKNGYHNDVIPEIV